MIKASIELFDYFKIKLGFLSAFLAERYQGDILEEPDNYKVKVICQISRMLETLTHLVKSKDVVSAICVLRNILDGISVYCFIYENEDKLEICFRHYLLSLDGFQSYHTVFGIMESNNRYGFEAGYQQIMNKIMDKIYSHPYMNNTQNKKTIQEIVRKKRWNYISLNSSKKYSYSDLYKKAKFESVISEYFSSYYSQYVHGLFLSNVMNVDAGNRTLFESIPMIIRLIASVFRTFPSCQEEMEREFLSSSMFKEFINNNDMIGELSGLLSSIRNDDFQIVIE